MTFNMKINAGKGDVKALDQYYTDQSTKTDLKLAAGAVEFIRSQKTLMLVLLAVSIIIF